MSTIASTRGKKVVYPESDGLPMADNTKQFRWIVAIQGGLDAIFRDDPNGVGKFALFHLHHKTKDVAALAASEAVIDLARGMNVEGRTLLRMKGAEAPEILSGLLQLDVFAHHADDVRLLLDAIRE